MESSHSGAPEAPRGECCSGGSASSSTLPPYTEQSHVGGVGGGRFAGGTKPR